MPASRARRCAFRVVRRVFDEGAFTDRAFRAEAERAGLDARDRAFAQHLAYTTVQRKATLDHVIERGLALHGRVGEVLREGAVARVEPRPLGLGAERAVGEGALVEHPPYNAERAAARAGCRHQLKPRSGARRARA